MHVFFGIIFYKVVIKMKKPFFIAVEGPIGAGKTSLAKRISEHFEFHLVKEIVEENPFLGKFYNDKNEWSFQTEMFFLCNRYKQLNDVKKLRNEAKENIVSDYHIFKNKIFSNLTLDPIHKEKYNQVYDVLIQDMPKPNLVVYLNASLDTLLHRISVRGRIIEKKMDPEYLSTLSKSYDSFVNDFKIKHPEVPVLFFNGDELDFVHQMKDLNFILSKIENELFAIQGEKND